MSPFRIGRRPLLALACLVAALAQAPVVTAHAALVSSDPAGGTTVPGPFAGPIVLTFSEALRAGSHAELIPAGGTKVADAAIDPGNAARLIFNLATPLAPGSFTIQWTSIAQDRDIERGELSFTVAQPTPPPTAPPTAAPTAAPSASPSPSAAPTATAVTASPTPSATPADQAAAGSDVLVPVIAALVLVAIAGTWLLRRGRRTG
jgi:methionine-rich copper-binding protein CopC